MVVREGVHHFGRFGVVAEGEGRETRGQACETLVVLLRGDEGAGEGGGVEVGAFFAPPAETSFLRVCGGGCCGGGRPDAEEERADEVEFREQDVDERDPLPFQNVLREDVGCNYPDWVSGLGFHACFGDELCDYGFAEDVHQVDEEGRALGGGRVCGVVALEGWRGGKEGGDGDGGAGDGEGGFEGGEDGGVGLAVDSLVLLGQLDELADGFLDRAAHVAHSLLQVFVGLGFGDHEGAHFLQAFVDGEVFGMLGFHLGIVG